MPRFFLLSGDDSLGFFEICGDDAHHISYSLRMREGEHITVCNGRGMDYDCEIYRMDGKTVSVRIVSFSPTRTESPVYIRLYQSIPKGGEKFDYIVQKAVELGVSEIIPVYSERCITKPGAGNDDKRITRLNRIAGEAAKQCGRGVVPEISEPLSFSDMIRDAGENCDAVLFCYENEKTESLYSALKALSPSLSEKDPPRLGIIIGSEGGFSISEAKAVLDRGFPAVSLGPRILRCETAAIFALSSVSFFFEQQAPFV